MSLRKRFWLSVVLLAAVACGGFPHDSKIAQQRIAYVPPDLAVRVQSWTDYDHCEVELDTLGKTYTFLAPNQLCIDLADSELVKKEVR